MLTIIIQREPEAKSADDKLAIGRVLSAINNDKALKKLKIDGDLKLIVTKRPLSE